MNDQADNLKDRYPADTELKFSGTILASVTHELNNVISIINQTGGLLEDFIFAAEKGTPIPPEKLKDIAKKISVHSERGIEIIKHLNKFAHSSDLIYGPFILNDQIENLCALLGRFVSLKGATLSTILIPDKIEVINFPFKVQQVIFLAFKIILSLTQKDDSIILSLSENESNCKINVKLETKRECILPDYSDIKNYANSISAELISNNDAGSVFIEIVLPTYVSNLPHNVE